MGELSDRDLFGLLTHVPPAPDVEPWTHLVRRNPLYWPRVAQVWACLGWLHVRTEEPWGTSTRRDVLGNLLFGPDDWTVDAAANALAVAAWNLPETRGEVLSLLMKRMLPVLKADKSRETELLVPLGELILSTPGVPEDARVRGPVRDILATYRSRGQAPTPAEFTPDALKKWGRGLKAEHDAQASPEPGRKRRPWRRSS